MISEVNKKETIDYIIHFLLQSNESLASYVHYLDKAEAIRECENYHRQIYIIRSHFFNDSIYGSEGSMPEWPLKKYKDMEILYGEAREEERNGNLLIYGDLIASSYFFLTRYEEMIRSTVRDIYGNYPARESLLYQINRLQVPVVDRYGELLCEKLKQLGYDLKETKNGFSKLYFTHDIDVPFSVYSFKNMIKAMGKSILKDRRIILYPLLNYMGYYGINPRSTWKYMLDRENSVGGGILKQRVFVL